MTWSPTWISRLTHVYKVTCLQKLPGFCDKIIFSSTNCRYKLLCLQLCRRMMWDVSYLCSALYPDEDDEYLTLQAAAASVVYTCVLDWPPLLQCSSAFHWLTLWLYLYPATLPPRYKSQCHYTKKLTRSTGGGGYREDVVEDAVNGQDERGRFLKVQSSVIQPTSLHPLISSHNIVRMCSMCRSSLPPPILKGTMNTRIPH